MAEKIKIGIIAALEREVAPLLREWNPAPSAPLSCVSRAWRKGGAVLLCSGIGPERAGKSAEAMINTFQPELVLTAGFVGALRPELEVGRILVPAHVKRASDGKAFGAAFGDGVLVSDDRVGGLSRKRELAAKFAADAVDMEAAAVAEVAATHGVKFAAIKAVSDGWNEDLDYLAPFASAEGFQTGRFLIHVATRPRLWGAVGRLKHNSERASAALCAAIAEFLSAPEEFAERWRAVPASQ